MTNKQAKTPAIASNPTIGNNTVRFTETCYPKETVSSKNAGPIRDKERIVGDWGVCQFWSPKGNRGSFPFAALSVRVRTTAFFWRGGELCQLKTAGLSSLMRKKWPDRPFRAAPTGLPILFASFPRTAFAGANLSWASIVGPYGARLGPIVGYSEP